MDPKYMTTDEAAAFLRVAKTTLYRWVHDARIPYRKHGSRVIFHRPDLERWSEEQVAVFMPEEKPNANTLS